MTSNPGMNMKSVLPLNARTVRIAAGGGLAASSRDFPVNGNAFCSGIIRPAHSGMPARRADAVPRARFRSASPIEPRPNETTIHHN